MSDLQGQSVLVTGGGSGIGLAVARMCLAEGARVTITSRDQAKLRAAAESLGGGERVFHVPADVADHAQVQAMVERTTAHFKAIDILVNNAGMNVKQRGVRELTPESWRQQIQANLDGAFFCCHAVLPQMLARQKGIIVNINSIAGKRAGPLGGAAYDASKFGMRGLAVCLAEELRESGIRVSTIYPGEVDTPILEHRPRPVSAEQRQKILQPEDVAAAVRFVLTLPPRASVPELVIKPTAQMYV